MVKEISNYDDVIDSRDIIERIEELESDDNRDDADNDELKILKELAEECSGYASDWEYGETLIRDSYFKDYAQELAEDCCEMPSPDQWPHRCIDWDQAAEELQQDYTLVDFDGVEYWIRSY